MEAPPVPPAAPAPSVDPFEHATKGTSTNDRNKSKGTRIFSIFNQPLVLVKSAPGRSYWLAPHSVTVIPNGGTDVTTGSGVRE